MEHHTAPGLGWSAYNRGALWAFGVLIPVTTIALEATNHLLASAWRDPMPSWLHFFVLLAVPGSYLAVDLLGHVRGWRPAGPLLLVNSFALTVSAVYLVVYLPVLPFAIVAVLLAGLGLLALTPLWCVLVGWAQLRALLRLAARVNMTRRAVALWLVGGLLVGGGLLGLPEARSLLVQRGLEQAFSGDLQRQADGLHLLRWLGAERDVLTRCYGLGDRSRQWAMFDDDDAATDLADAQRHRELYYRLTGRAFNSVPRPKRGADGERLEGRWIDDSEIGGAAVGGLVRGLRIASSTLDGVIEASTDTGGPAIAYLEWTLEFRNDSDMPREARAQITLPSGAVASRLTLWIDGQERPAAYGKRSHVTQAYRNVAVRERRDPALLNAVGPERVLLQCFPIAPSATLKTKVGITAPLVLREGRAYLQLPHISERNFAIGADFRHGVWVESPGPVAIPGSALKASPMERGVMVRGMLSDAQLQSPVDALVATAGRIDTLRYVASHGGRHATMDLVARPTAPAPVTVCLVIDGSVTMAEVVGGVDWTALGRALPAGSKVQAILAADRPALWKPDWAVPAEVSSEIQGWLASQSFVGGCSPEGALEYAWDLCAQRGGGLIVWIHGALPVELRSSEGLKQRFRRLPGGSAGGPVLVAVQCLAGPNRLVETLGDVEGFRRVPVLLSLQHTLEQAVSGADATGLYRVFSLAEPVTAAVANERSVRASGHVVRLAAAERVMAAFRAGKADADVTELAIAMQIITPLSGAVVLESRAQYAREGLAPSGPEMEPVIPEPSALLLLGMGWLVLRRRPKPAAVR